MSTQSNDSDWTTVAPKPRKPAAAKPAPEPTYTTPKRPSMYNPRPDTVVVQNSTPKFTQNRPRVSADGARMRALESDDPEAAAPIKKYSRAVSQAVQAARLGKSMSQAQLAVKVSERPDVIARVENGTGAVDIHLLQRLEKVLGTKLTGKGFTS